MDPGRRAVARFWQPDWLVLREIARVLRGLLAFLFFFLPAMLVAVGRKVRLPSPGSGKNRDTIDVFCRQAYEIGIVDRLVTAEEYFADFLAS